MTASEFSAFTQARIARVNALVKSGVKLEKAIKIARMEFAVTI